MSMQKPLEALLRPPLEWYTVLVALTAILLIYSAPNLFLIPSSGVYMAVAVLLIFSLYRFKQGYRVFRYQLNLKRMPTYKLTSKQIPTSDRKLFLGKGFLWTTTHTQRLRDLDLPYNLHYKNPSSYKRWARKKELEWENKSSLKNLGKRLAKDSPWNPFRPYPDIGGQPCIHGVSEREENIAINLADRASHMVVVGLPEWVKPDLQKYSSVRIFVVTMSLLSSTPRVMLIYSSAYTQKQNWQAESRIS